MAEREGKTPVAAAASVDVGAVSISPDVGPMIEDGVAVSAAKVAELTAEVNQMHGRGAVGDVCVCVCVFAHASGMKHSPRLALLINTAD
jgi:hypothetical protein